MTPRREEPLKKPSRDRVPWVVASVISLVLAGMLISGGDRLLARLDNFWLDVMFQIRGMQAGDPRLTLVAIDDETVKKYSDKAEYLLLKDDLLFKLGAKVVGYKILFLSPGSKERDAVLVAATRKRPDRLVHSTAADPAVTDRFVFRPPFPALAKATKHLGTINQPYVSPDGSLRQTCLVIGKSIFDPESWPGDKDRTPSLPLKMVSLYEDRPVESYLDDGNFFYINFLGRKHGDSGPRGVRKISAAKILSGELSDGERAALSGGLVLVGHTTTRMAEKYPTPYGIRVPGVEILADITDNILACRMITTASFLIDIFLIFFFAFLCAWTVRLAPIAFASLGLTTLAAWALANYTAFRMNVYLPFSGPGMSLILTLTFLFVRKTMYERLSKERITRIFGQFVAPTVVQDLVEAKADVELGGETREMTVMFVDIANFTALSEDLKAQELISFLNRHLRNLSRVIHEREGVIDKYIGDSIMAFWNAPLPQAEHAAMACLAAIECQKTAAELTSTAGDGMPGAKIRIGLCTGPMVVGVTGSDLKMQYTVIGDTVNLASRLEGANKFFGSEVLVNSECYAAAKDSLEGRELGSITVVGRAQPVRVFEIISEKGKLPAKWTEALPNYARGLELFKARSFAEAKEAFWRVLEFVPGDIPSQKYLDSIEDLLKNPPPDGWEPVFNVLSKA